MPRKQSTMSGGVLDTGVFCPGTFSSLLPDSCCQSSSQNFSETGSYSTLLHTKPSARQLSMEGCSSKAGPSMLREEPCSLFTPSNPLSIHRKAKNKEESYGSDLHGGGLAESHKCFLKSAWRKG